MTHVGRFQRWRGAAAGVILALAALTTPRTYPFIGAFVLGGLMPLTAKSQRRPAFEQLAVALIVCASIVCGWAVAMHGDPDQMAAVRDLYRAARRYRRAAPVERGANLVVQLCQQYQPALCDHRRRARDTLVVAASWRASIQRGAEVKEEPVRAVRLSDYITAPVDFLKIDIEGAEPSVVRDLVNGGAIKWIRETAIEYHHREPQADALERMAEALRAAGFDVRVQPVDDRLRMVRARRANQVGELAVGRSCLLL